MRRIAYFVLAIVIVLASVAIWYMHPFNQEIVLVSEDFENGLGKWEPDFQLPEDPNNPGSLVDWNISADRSVRTSGTYSVKLFVDGTQDDGTVWIERKLYLEPNSLNDINVSFQFYSAQESYNLIAVVVGYVGVENPEAEVHFRVLGTVNQVTGWKIYGFSERISTGSNGIAYVAVGISVRWESLMTYFIDDVRIEVS